MAEVRGMEGSAQGGGGEARAYLGEHLPAEYVVVGPAWGGIEVVVVREDGLVVLGVCEWFGRISSIPDSNQLHVGRLRQPQPHPAGPATRQAESLAAYLRQPDTAARFLDDPRARFGLRVAAAILLTHPAADLQLAENEAVPWLRLDDPSIARLTGPDFGQAHFHLHPRERARLAALLAGPPGEPTPTPSPRRHPARLRPRLASPEPPAPRFVYHPDEPSSQPAPAAPGLSTVARAGFSWITALLDGFERKAGQLLEPSGHTRGAVGISQQRLARLLENAMETNLVHLIQETVAPNDFLVKLASPDFQHYAPFQARGRQELVAYLQQVAAARDYHLLAPLNVSVAHDPSLTPGDPLITTTVAALPASEAVATLELRPAGPTLPLVQPLTTLGRSRQNTICLAQDHHPSSVSRHHAHIRCEDGRYLLYDGDGQHSSQWGTFVNGRRLDSQGHPLQDGDHIILGPPQRLHTRQPLPGSVLLIFHIAGGHA